VRLYRFASGKAVPNNYGEDIYALIS